MEQVLKREQSRPHEPELTVEGIRVIESNLKESLDWYVPLEDILGMPVIGEDKDKFIGSIDGHTKDDLHFKVRVPADRDFFILHVYPETAEGQDLTDLKQEDGLATIYISILPDNTLRPWEIYDYSKMFRDDSKSSPRANIAHMELAGRQEPAVRVPMTEGVYLDNVSHLNVVGYGEYGSTSIKSYDNYGELVWQNGVD
ncbi:hypothetical protein F4X86_01080 [Candidatus Saccharibacteria bacterium]|nr:hypothetical protein [Candidatus Saccharibacteria bacterium]